MSGLPGAAPLCLSRLGEKPIAQDEFLNLARRGLGKLLHEAPKARYFVGCQVVVAECRQFRILRHGSWLWLDEGRDCLTPFLVRNADHGHVRHLRMSE